MKSYNVIPVSAIKPSSVTYNQIVSSKWLAVGFKLGRSLQSNMNMVCWADVGSQDLLNQRYREQTTVPVHCPQVKIWGRNLYQKTGLNAAKGTINSLKLLIWIFQKFLLVILWPILKWKSYLSKVKTVPPVTNPILLHSAGQLATKIRNREISSREVVAAFIARAEEINPIVNGIVQDRFADALRDAIAVDNEIDKNPNPEFWKEHKPFFGVPISIKESLAVNGMSHNAGTLKWKKVANRDSCAVSNLRAAGAIPFAVTNTPELCLFWETYNYVTGTTKNLFNTNMTAGGSSGGECVLIGSGASPFGLASDIGGSGRLPSQHSGIFGHKPTGGIISVDGHIPVSCDPEWDRFFVISPQAHHACDLPLLMKTAAPEASQKLGLDQTVDIKELKIFYLESHTGWFTDGVGEEIVQTVRKVVSYFNTKHGLDTCKVSIQDFDSLLIPVILIMCGMTPPPQTVLMRSDDTADIGIVSCIIEMIKVLLGCSIHTLYAVQFVFLLIIVRSLPQHLTKTCKKYKESLSKEIEETLGDNGVLILPVSTSTAKEHMMSYFYVSSTVYLLMANLLDLPATSIPIGFDKNGLPISVQVVAKRCNDRLTLAVAKQLEQAFGGWLLTRRNT